ncbi:hypothetical protein C5167_007908 [Papaver somniferum]|nr:hypothetical protein C5167_007908 [Papaver somniferum]
MAVDETVKIKMVNRKKSKNEKFVGGSMDFKHLVMCHWAISYFLLSVQHVRPWVPRCNFITS